MQPRTVRTEDHFSCSGPSDRLNDVVKPAHACRIGENVRMTHQLIDNLLLRPPIVQKASQMRNDEVDVAILGCEQFDNVGTARNVDEHRNAKRSDGLTHFARWQGIVAMHFESPKSVSRHRALHEAKDPSTVAGRVNGGETDQTIRISSADSRELGVRRCVVAMPRRYDDCFGDPRSPRP